MLKVVCSILLVAGGIGAPVVRAQVADPAAAHLPADTIPRKAAPAPADNALRSLVTDSLPVSLGDSLKAEVNTPVKVKTISLRSVIIPSAMIAYGAFALTSKELKELNLAVRKEVWEDRNDGNGRRVHIDNFTLLAPAVAVYGLNLAGIKGKNNLVDRTMLFGMSNLIGQGLIVSNVKKLSRIIRPDSSNTLSFPSGHTTQAFISAEFLRQEYRHLSPWYGIAGYTVAVGTGFLRMYNNKHWLNDVIAGAGVGILSTRISYWLYPKLKNTVLKKFRGQTMIAPTYQQGAFGVGMLHRF
ncbi:MAG TPA: phosphatase PAP2 family protein [Chitinophagaceae bacterium]|jgi:hypothetical protein|nr:phosphatase PAP2 family protein [Chitinophagaceae bacterium]